MRAVPFHRPKRIGPLSRFERNRSKTEPDFLYESLTDPQAFVYLDYRHGGVPKEYPATMPAINKNPIGLSKNEILAIIAFLQQMSGEPISVSTSELECRDRHNQPQ